MRTRHIEQKQGSLSDARYSEIINDSETHGYKANRSEFDKMDHHQRGHLMQSLKDNGGTLISDSASYEEI